MIEKNFFYKNLKKIYENIKNRNFYIKKLFFKKLINIKNKLLNIIFTINKKKLNKNIFFKYFFIIFKKIFFNFFKKINNKLKKILIKIPNLIHFSVQKNNIIIKKINKEKNKKKNHIDLGKYYGLDFKSAAKISGYGFSIIKEPILILYKAVIKFMMNIHKKEHNFKEINIPYIVNLKTIISSGQIPKFKNKLFFLNKSRKKYLIPTSEVPLINIFRNKILKNKILPIKIFSFSQCFRKEKKNYGKKNKGLIRQLQFDKIELIIITDKKNSYKELIETIKYAEKILKKLKIGYRIILLSKTNVGITSCKTYDIEAWLPSIKDYIEVSSCSNTESFQSIRLNLKYKKNKKKLYPHIINASGLAIGRTFISLIENYQKKNSIKIPICLKKYMKNKKKIIRKNLFSNT